MLLTDDTLITGAIEDALNDPDPRVLPVVLSDVAKIKGLSVADLAEGAQSSGSEAIYASLSNCSPALAASSRVLLSR